MLFDCQGSASLSIIDQNFKLLAANIGSKFRSVFWVRGLMSLVHFDANRMTRLQPSLLAMSLISPYCTMSLFFHIFTPLCGTYSRLQKGMCVTKTFRYSWQALLLLKRLSWKSLCDAHLWMQKFEEHAPIGDVDNLNLCARRLWWYFPTRKPRTALHLYSGFFVDKSTKRRSCRSS